MTKSEKQAALEVFLEWHIANENRLYNLYEAESSEESWLAAWEASRAAMPAGVSTTKFKLDGSYGSILEGHWFYLAPADGYAKQALIEAGYVLNMPAGDGWISVDTSLPDNRQEVLICDDIGEQWICFYYPENEDRHHKWRDGKSGCHGLTVRFWRPLPKLPSVYYCDHCGMEINPEHVTHSETHDVRYGGCGHEHGLIKGDV